MAEDLSVYDDLPEDDAQDSTVPRGEGSDATVPRGEGLVATPQPVSQEAQVKEAMRYLRSGAAMPTMPNMAVPEHSHAGESPSNGRAERSIRTFVELFSCLKACFEARLIKCADSDSGPRNF